MKTSSRLLALTVSLCPLVDVTSQNAPGPNFVVLQPDDLRFFEEWMPPAQFPKGGGATSFPTTGLPNIERLRKEGLEMKQAYTASSMCGTSRYSTMTGRYPSRSSYGRKKNSGKDIAVVTIPTTKLEDIGKVDDGNDCSAHNLAALFSQNDYHTGVVGKWHLYSGTGKNEYNYTVLQEQIRSCGFNFAEAIYAENMGAGGFFHDDTFSHNMEYVTTKALDFMDEAKAMDKPFFLYINPTVPHGSGNVYEALTKYDCTDTPEGPLKKLRDIPKMTSGTTCSKYRQTVVDRADQSQENNRLGSIWVDDSIGAILKTLEDNGQLENTFFLFQMDHGQEGNGSLYEPGLRLTQFIHFPDKFGTRGIWFDGPVSTIDIGPTMLEYAGIDSRSNGFYEMDGLSWKSAVEDSSVRLNWKTNRCLEFELFQDRAARCGCEKYIRVEDVNSSNSAKKGSKKGVGVDTEVLFNVCDDNGQYITTTSPEVVDIKDSNPEILENMRTLVDCHLAKTKPDLFPLYFSCTTEVKTPSTRSVGNTSETRKKNRTNRNNRKNKRRRKQTGQT